MDISLFSPYFLGSYGENNHEFEDIFLEFFRDHVYWRRSFHPEDLPPVSIIEKQSSHYLETMAKTKQELHKLSADLKQSVPFSNPRYIGHMASDLLLPGMLAQFITALYNPNNVTEEAAPVTVKMELEVGNKLAEMFGYNLDADKGAVAWGHLTSGGTVANYQSLWMFRSVKYYPLAVKRCGELADIDFVDGQGRSLQGMSTWELMNLSIDEVVQIRVNCLNKLKAMGDEKYDELIELLREQRIEHQGHIDFFDQHKDLKQPVVFVPATAHYSWIKAMKILGIGSKNLWQVPTDEKMRLDPMALKQLLLKAKSENRTVLAVIGVLGTTEFGTVDPISDIVSLRDEMSRDEGLNYYIHVDAAWGGYLSSVFRDENNRMREHEAVKAGFEYFPSAKVYNAFAALCETDSITVDPHKLGYMPFGSGAFIARNKNMCGFVVQEAAYVFDKKNRFVEPEPKLNQLGQYIMEGSKPGAAAAASYVAQNVLPLNAEHFGKLPASTIRTTEVFYHKIAALSEKLAGKATLIAPIEPDTNLICLAINPAGNSSTRVLNDFTRKVFEHIKIEKSTPMFSKEFIGSYTSIFRKNINDKVAHNLCFKLGLDPHSFVRDVEQVEFQDNALFVLRHTLMNPWLSDDKNGVTYMDMYLNYLEEIIVKLVEQ
ncbi:pyridoxal phosphate-dependent decarboxylase family protein [Pseudoalteromonas umbrosa]|uniref:pyridoxal phosphate-dependent decarboxylase family protein n=1 Tax=Pseudoalteromonas umbrosa TaxID=3048489 RepID=UPI0024C23574|nr:pyridoxal-dependent decarboxylase [Pseudoalteromonas sp. B95]MDK1286783.1 pyridoxal-dependent decarboxylase [Pseudoalteromonas sp. B95]